MLKTSSTSIKQQPYSPVSYHSYSNNFYPYHHRQSTTSSDNEQSSSTLNRNAESPPTNNLVPAPVIVDEGGEGTPEERRRCAVCSDVASGYHYGVWSCEGCKAFFKRSIQGTNDYICPATNTCTIDKHRRKSCQACRLRKCYEVGMTKGTTRRERKYRKKAVSVCKITSTSSHANATQQLSTQDQNSTSIIQHSRTSTSTPNNSQLTNSNTYSSSQLNTNKSSSDTFRYSTRTAEFLSILSQASRLNLPAKTDTTRLLDDQYFLQLLAKIFDQELVVLINWAKAMPGYTASLTLDEQVTIIEQSWLDALILDIIERSLERNDDTLQFAPDLLISRNRDLTSPILGSVCTYLFNILNTFKDPRTTHEEFIALKATLLINSIPTNLAATKSFRLLTNQIYQTIQDTCDSNPSIYRDNYLRYFTLLLQIPHIKILSSKLTRLFLYMRSNDLLPQADLLLEMLDAQDSFDLPFNIDVNNHSLSTDNFSTETNSTNTTSFTIDNLSLFPNQYSNISTLDMNKETNNLSDLS